MSALPNAAPSRAARFAYGRLDVDEAAGVLRCHYELDELRFTETVEVGEGHRWTAAAHEAARLVHLVAGVSYYKAGAPPVIDLGPLALSEDDRAFLRQLYLQGLGEFAFRNHLSLEDLELVGGSHDPGRPVPTDLGDGRPLVPFGGGIDSLVTVDVVTRRYADVALFVADQRRVRFEAIEQAAAATGLPVLRAHRSLDPALLRPADPARFFNGHVPITAILSAIAVLVAVLDGRDLVVMSNEWSASKGNLEVDGRPVNHQHSKSEAYERAFRALLARRFAPPPQWFSLLRARSELWVADRFAGLPHFHGVVHSCNRAFHLDPAQRQVGWCGECDKCCFIDLILSPFLDRGALAAVFDGREPLEDERRLPQLRALLGLGDARKPFECVGDVDECRTAAALAVERPDRAGNRLLRRLVDELGPAAATARDDAPRLMAVLGPHWVPDALLDAASLV